MNFCRYYGRVFRVAFSHSLDIAQGVIFALVILAGLVTWLFPAVRMTVDLAGWQVAIVALGSIVVLRFILASYWLYREQRETLAQFEAQAQRSDIELTLYKEMAWCVDIDAAGGRLPGTMAFMIQITNNGSRFLQKCQLMFEKYPASGYFDLRPGESRDLPLLRIHQTDDPRPIVYFIEPQSGKISDGSGWLPNPSLYHVKAFSADSYPAVLAVQLSTTAAMPPREWHLSPCA